MNTHSGPIRVLVAAGVNGTAIVMAHDSPWLAADIEQVGVYVGDLGLDDPPDTGLWLWEGEGRLAVHYNAGGGDPPDPQYTGKYRGVEPHELPALLALAPPEVCVVCGKPAVDNYPDADGEPSCGSPECEIRMQAAADYHDERG